MNRVQLRNAIEIRTDIDGYNSGRVYLLRSSSEETGSVIAGLLADTATRSRREYETRTRLQRMQDRCRAIYLSSAVQGLIAVLIVAVSISFARLKQCISQIDFHECRQNFAMSVGEAQMIQRLDDEDGRPTNFARMLQVANVFFTVAFAVELTINLACNWLRRFVTDGWSLLDLVLVSLSLASLGPLNISSSVLRTLRAFRVIKIFSKLEQVKKILFALATALEPVMYAFFMMLVVLCICKRSCV